MKCTALKPFLFLWLTVFVGCSGLLIATSQPVRGQHISPVLLAQQSGELEEAKRLKQQVIQLDQRWYLWGQSPMRQIYKTLRLLLLVTRTLDLRVYENKTHARF